MRKSRIRAKLRENEPALITTLHLCDPSLFELASLMGFDGLWLDLEHHSHSVETAQTMMRAARVGTSDVVARPAKGEFMRLGRLLEAGAQGIMYPRCDNAAEAADVVKWSKFPPLGSRGCDGGNADMPYLSMPLSSYMAAANNETFIAIQLEEQHAIECADEIAAVEGVDILMFGPGDYSASIGVPGQMAHPKLEDATIRIANAARRQGKHWGRPVANAEDAKKYIDLGARFLTCGADIVMVKNGLEQLQRQFEALGMSFHNLLDGGTRDDRDVPAPKAIGLRKNSVERI